MVSKCSLIMENCTTSFHSIFFICVITGVIFLTRLYIDDYCNRFYVNDLFHRVLYFLYAMTLFVLTLNVNVLNIEEEEGLERSDANCKANIYGDAFEVAYVHVYTCVCVCVCVCVSLSHTSFLSNTNLHNPLTRAYKYTGLYRHAC